MQVRQKRAVSTGVPAKNVQQAGDGIWRAADSPASRTFWLAAFSEVRGRRQRSRPAALAFVETEDTANFGVDIQFAKVGRLFRPLHSPVYAADKIGFMGAIPCSNPDLDK